MDKQPETKHDIFSKPLPMIIDEMESATTEAREAAAQARKAGEQAADEVMKRLRKVFIKMAKDITEELADSKK
jgi:hypothetical protein